jgi:hypothetical protein
MSLNRPPVTTQTILLVILALRAEPTTSEQE